MTTCYVAHDCPLVMDFSFLVNDTFQGVEEVPALPYFLRGIGYLGNEGAPRRIGSSLQYLSGSYS